MSTIYVLTGPSFSGKSTIASMLGYPRNVTSTTRQPRPGEIHGVHYHFLNRDDFLQGVGEGAFIEHASYDGNLYGTSSSSVADSLKQGNVVLNVMEMEGTLKLKSLFPNEVTTIFLSADLETLISRSKEREADMKEKRSRIQTLKDELAQAYHCDFSIKNEDLEKTLKTIRWIIEERM